MVPFAGLPRADQFSLPFPAGPSGLVTAVDIVVPDPIAHL